MNEDAIFIMHFFNAPPLGLNIRNEHDAHITFLAQIIRVENVNNARLLREVEEIAKNTPKFLIQFGTTSYFGVDHDKPVVQLVKTPEGERLHLDLLQAATSLGLLLGQPQYAGQNFQPHVSLPLGGSAPRGSKVVDTISMVINFNSKQDDSTEVIGNFSLRG